MLLHCYIIIIIGFANFYDEIQLAKVQALGKILCVFLVGKEKRWYTGKKGKRIYIPIYINMNMLKRLQDSLKSGKNDPFPSPFNTSAFSNSSSSILNINRLSPRTAKRKGKNKENN